MAFIGAFNLKLNYDVKQRQNHIYEIDLLWNVAIVGGQRVGASFNIYVEHSKLLSVNTFANCNYQLNVINSFVLLRIYLIRLIR